MYDSLQSRNLFTSCDSWALDDFMDMANMSRNCVNGSGWPILWFPVSGLRRKQHTFTVSRTLPILVCSKAVLKGKKLDLQTTTNFRKEKIRLKIVDIFLTLLGNTANTVSYTHLLLVLKIIKHIISKYTYICYKSVHACLFIQTSLPSLVAVATMNGNHIWSRRWTT